MSSEADVEVNTFFFEQQRQEFSEHFGRQRVVAVAGPYDAVGGSADAAAVVGGFPVILERFACIRFQHRDDFPDVLTVVVLLDGPVRPESQDDTGHYGDKVREKRSPRFGFKQIHRLGSFHVPAVSGPDAGLSND